MDGLDAFRRSMARLAKRAGTATPGILEDAAELIKVRAQDNAPVDTGRLRDSAEVEVDESEATVTFTAPYATFVHEDLEASHDNGGPKFLEQAARETQEQVRQELAEAFQREFKR